MFVEGHPRWNGNEMIESKKVPVLSVKQKGNLRRELCKTLRKEHSGRLEALDRILESAQASQHFFVSFGFGRSRLPA